MTKIIRVSYNAKAHEATAFMRTASAVRYHGAHVTRHHMNPLINWLLSLVKGEH